jgi:hypothetical protein
MLLKPEQSLSTHLSLYRSIDLDWRVVERCGKNWSAAECCCGVHKKRASIYMQIVREAATGIGFIGSTKGWGIHHGQ